MEGVCRGLSVVRVPLTKMIALASSRLRRPCPWVAAKTSTSVLGIRRSIASAVSVGAPRVRSSIDEVVGPGMTMTRLPLQKPSRLGSLFPGPRPVPTETSMGPLRTRARTGHLVYFLGDLEFHFSKTTRARAGCSPTSCTFPLSLVSQSSRRSPLRGKNALSLLVTPKKEER